MKLLISMVTLSFGLMTPAHAADVNVVEIMQKNHAVNKMVDSAADATITLTNEAGQERTRKTFTVTKLQANGEDNMRMTRIEAPADVKGTVTLAIEHSVGDDDIWVYLPALKKVRRLISSNKKDSFIGTDFSYGDVIGHKVAEWNYKMLPEESIDGAQCYVIEATPSSDEVRNNSGYSKRLIWMQKDNFFAIKSDLWDEAGEPVKAFHMTNLRELDPERHKWDAMVLEAKNLQTGHRTVIKFGDYKANQNVGDEYFTTRHMEQE